MSADKSRPNELRPDLLSTVSLMPWPGHCSSSRIQMFAGHITQALPVRDATDRRCFTGMEAKFGEYTFGTVLKNDAKRLKVLQRYPRRMGINGINQNPETIVLFEHKKQTIDGREYMEVDYLSLPTHHTMGQHFGFEFKHPSPINEYMAEGTILSQSPNVSDQGNYRYGLEAEVAMMSVPQIIEDGVVASESFCERATTTGVETFSVSWGKKRFPLNLYGDDEHYKPFPDIGEKVRSDGILLALREYDEASAPVTMSKEALRRPDYKYDERTYVEPEATVVDVVVHHDVRLSGVIRGKSLNTPVGMSEQVEKYLHAEQNFYQSILNEYERLKQQRRGAVNISPKLHRLLVEAMAMTPKGQKQRMSRTYRGAPIDEWRVEITIAYPVRPTVGFKLTGCAGDKGVIVDVVPDEDMPVDKDGNRAELIMDGHSTIKRMNPARLLEQYINAASRDLTKKLRKMAEAGEPKETLNNELMGYYQIVSPRMVDLVSEQGMVTDKHLQSVLDKGIYIWMPTDHEREAMDIIRDLTKHYPALYDTVTYRGMSGQHVETVKPVLIGSMYIMLLEKTGRNWAGVASSKLSHFGVPAKLTTADRYSTPGRAQPIRFGESEGRLFVATVGGRATAELYDRTNNPIVRKKIQDRILREEKPTAVDSMVDRRLYPSGQGRVLSLIHHLGECSGWRFTRIDDNN